MKYKGVICFGFLIFSILSVPCFAVLPEEKLSYAKALIVAQIDYENSLSDYFLKIPKDAEEEEELREAYSDLIRFYGPKLDATTVSFLHEMNKMTYQNILDLSFSGEGSLEIQSMSTSMVELFSPFYGRTLNPSTVLANLKIKKMILAIVKNINHNQKLPSFTEEHGMEAGSPRSRLFSIRDTLASGGLDGPLFTKDYELRWEDGESSPVIFDPGFSKKIGVIDSRLARIHFDESYPASLTNSTANSTHNRLLARYRDHLGSPLHNVYKEYLKFDKALQTKISLIRNFMSDEKRKQALKPRLIEHLRFSNTDVPIYSHLFMSEYAALLKTIIQEQDDIDAAIAAQMKNPGKGKKKVNNTSRIQQPEAVPVLAETEVKIIEPAESPSESAVVKAPAAVLATLPVSVTPVEDLRKKEVREKISDPIAEQTDRTNNENGVEDSKNALLRTFNKWVGKNQSNLPLRSKEWLEVQRKFAKPKYRSKFELLFDDLNNHHVFTFEELVKLVNRAGGRVEMKGSSHCMVVVPGGVSYSWRPHGKQRTGTVPRFCVQLLRKAFEMAEITPATLFK